MLWAQSRCSTGILVSSAADWAFFRSVNQHPFRFGSGFGFGAVFFMVFSFCKICWTIHPCSDASPNDVATIIRQDNPWRWAKFLE